MLYVTAEAVTHKHSWVARTLQHNPTQPQCCCSPSRADRGGDFSFNHFERCRSWLPSGERSNFPAGLQYVEDGIARDEADNVSAGNHGHLLHADVAHTVKQG